MPFSSRVELAAVLMISFGGSGSGGAGGNVMAGFPASEVGGSSHKVPRNDSEPPGPNCAAADWTPVHCLVVTMSGAT